jgi:ABC-2 type transport system permease protein
MVAVYTVVFTKFMPGRFLVTGYQGTRSFAAFLISSLLAWNYFANSLMFTVGSLVDSGPLIRKAYFPRELIPISGTLANLVNYGFELVIISIFFLVIGNNFLVLTPVLLIIIFFQTLFILAMAMLFSLINVYFRDMKHITTLITLIWFWACPIIYPYEMAYGFLKERQVLLFIYNANPMVAFVRAYQKVFYHVQYPGNSLMIYIALISVGFFVLSYALFKRYEYSIASEV